MTENNDKIIGCDECGRAVLATAGLDLCPECFAAQVEAYERIEKVLAVAPDISPSELSTQAQVNRSVIKRLARKGRIKLRQSDEAVHCQRCNELMDEVGRFCARCRAELMFLAKDAASALKDKVREQSAMRSRTYGVVKALTKKRSIFRSRSSDFGTKGKYSP
jgi:predicted amidophosphoribosyltransferase